MSSTGLITSGNKDTKDEVTAPIIILRVVNVLAFIAVVLVNYVGASNPPNGKSVGDISDENPTFITPAGMLTHVAITIPNNGHVTMSTLQGMPSQSGG